MCLRSRVWVCLACWPGGEEGTRSRGKEGLKCPAEQLGFALGIEEEPQRILSGGGALLSGWVGEEWGAGVLVLWERVSSDWGRN